MATLCSVALFFGSCHKDNALQSTGNDVRFPNDPIEQLRTFRKQIDVAKAHPNERSQEAIPLSDALWDVENHFNLTYSDPEQYYESTTTHEFTLMLPVDADQRVLVNDAVSLYNQVTDESRQALSTDAYEDKGVVSLQIDQAEVLDEVIQLSFKVITGERTAYNLPTTILGGPFTIGDDWLAASPMGKCDDPDIPSGADKELQEKLFDELIGTLPEANPGQRNIFIDRKIFVFDGRDYSGIYLSDNTEDFCIPYVKMNQLYNAEKRVIKTTIPETHHLVGYVPISIEILGYYLENEAKYTHHNEIVYGRQYRVNIDEFGEVQDLLQD